MLQTSTILTTPYYVLMNFVVSIVTWYVTTKRNIKTRLHIFWDSFILNCSHSQYMSVQFCHTDTYKTKQRRFIMPAIMFSRVYMGKRKMWTPVLVRVNPVDLPIKRPRSLGRRWGKNCIWHY